MSRDPGDECDYPLAVERAVAFLRERFAAAMRKPFAPAVHIENTHAVMMPAGAALVVFGFTVEAERDMHGHDPGDEHRRSGIWCHDFAVELAA